MNLETFQTVLFVVGAVAILGQVWIGLKYAHYFRAADRSFIASLKILRRDHPLVGNLVLSLYVGTLVIIAVLTYLRWGS